MKHPTQSRKRQVFFAQTFLLAKKLCFEHIGVVPDFYLWVALHAHSSLGAWRMFLGAAALASAKGQSAPWTMGLLCPPEEAPLWAPLGSVTCSSWNHSCWRCKQCSQYPPVGFLFHPWPRQQLSSRGLTNVTGWPSSPGRWKAVPSLPLAQGCIQ